MKTAFIFTFLTITPISLYSIDSKKGTQEQMPEKIRIEYPILYLAKYTLELQKTPRPNEPSKFTYEKVSKGVHLTTMGKIFGCSIIALLLKRRFR